MNPEHIAAIVLGCFNITLMIVCLIIASCSRSRVKKQVEGLSASQLRKLPKVTGKDLVMGTDCCAVCLDEIESDQPARMILGCNHGFHLQCADEWLTKTATCPICRADISSEFFDDAPGTNPEVAVAV